MESENRISESIIEDQKQEQVVLFKFKRAYQDESFDEIKIQTKNIKPNPQTTQKATQNYKNKHFLDRQTMLTELFQKLELNNIKPQQQNKADIQQVKQNQQSSSRKYFLKRVAFENQITTNNPRQSDVNEIRNKAKNYRLEVRRQEIEKKFGRTRQIGSKDSENKRIKYKIIDIRKQNIVDFNGQRFEYEDLSKQYGPNQRNSDYYDYYILSKGPGSISSNYPQIILPQQAQYLLEAEQANGMQVQTPQDSEADSNREDQSDYDYPQEEYHEGDSDDKSEGIISGKRSNDKSYGSDNDNEDLRNDYEEEDEEQYYRQYLKRCKRKDKGDDELTYLYNLKSAKYEEDSDD